VQRAIIPTNLTSSSSDEDEAPGAAHAQRSRRASNTRPTPSRSRPTRHRDTLVGDKEHRGLTDTSHYQLNEDDLARFMPARSQSLEDAMAGLAASRRRKAAAAARIAEERLHVMEKEIQRAQVVVRMAPKLLQHPCFTLSCMCAMSPCQTQHEYEQAVLEEERRRTLSKSATSAQARAEAALNTLARVQRQAAREAARRDQLKQAADSAAVNLQEVTRQLQHVRCACACVTSSLIHRVVQAQNALSTAQSMRSSVGPVEAELAAARSAAAAAQAKRSEVAALLSQEQARHEVAKGATAAAVERSQQLMEEVACWVWAQMHLVWLL